MKKFSNRIRITALLALSFFSFGCGQNPASSERAHVRIAYFPNIIHAQALVLKNQKTPEQKWEGKCDVTFTPFNAGPAEIEAMFAGEIDIGYMGPGPAVNANVKSNGEVVIISNAANAGAVFLVQPDAGISSAKDLAGKKIAVPQIGNTQHLCLLGLLRENGLDEKDVSIRASSNADIVNLMGNGSVDGAVVPEPWGSMMEQNGNAKILFDYDELYLDGDYPSALVAASRDFIEKHPDLVQDFLEMHENATDFINENPEEMLDIVNTEIKNATGKSLDEDVILSAFSRIVITDEWNTEAVMAFASLSKEEGFTNIVPEENDVFYNQFSQ